MEDTNEEYEALESTAGDDLQNEDSTEDNTNSEHRNKSNWKKMSEAKKTLEKELKEARQELSKVKDWANSLYEEDQQKPFTKTEAREEKQTNETLDDVVTFYQKNPEAMEFKDLIVEAMQEYGVDRSKAWKLVKMEIPEESKTRRDFNLSGKAPTQKKSLKDMNPEEALKLSKEEKREWRKLNGYG